MPFPLKLDTTYDDLFSTIGKATSLSVILVCGLQFYHLITVFIILLVVFGWYELKYDPHHTNPHIEELNYLQSIDKHVSIEILRKKTLRYRNQSTASSTVLNEGDSATESRRNSFSTWKDVWGKFTRKSSSSGEDEKDTRIQKESATGVPNLTKLMRNDYGSKTCSFLDSNDKSTLLPTNTGTGAKEPSDAEINESGNVETQEENEEVEKVKGKTKNEVKEKSVSSANLASMSTLQVNANQRHIENLNSEISGEESSQQGRVDKVIENKKKFKRKSNEKRYTSSYGSHPMKKEHAIEKNPEECEMSQEEENEGTISSEVTISFNPPQASATVHVYENEPALKKDKDKDNVASSTVTLNLPHDSMYKSSLTGTSESSSGNSSPRGSPNEKTTTEKSKKKVKKHKTKSKGAKNLSSMLTADLSKRLANTLPLPLPLSDASGISSANSSRRGSLVDADKKKKKKTKKHKKKDKDEKKGGFGLTTLFRVKPETEIKPPKPNDVSNDIEVGDKDISVSQVDGPNNSSGGTSKLANINKSSSIDEVFV